MQTYKHTNTQSYNHTIIQARWEMFLDRSVRSRRHAAHALYQRGREAAEYYIPYHPPIVLYHTLPYRTIPYSALPYSTLNYWKLEGAAGGSPIIPYRTLPHCTLP